MTNMITKNRNPNTHATIVEGNMPNDSVQHMVRNVTSVANSIILQNTAKVNTQYSSWPATNVTKLTICLLGLCQEQIILKYDPMSAIQHWMLRIYL